MKLAGAVRHKVLRIRQEGACEGSGAGTFEGTKCIGIEFCLPKSMLANTIYFR